MTDPVQDDGHLLCSENKRDTRATEEYDFRHKPYCKMDANTGTCIESIKKHGSASLVDADSILGLHVEDR